MKKIFPLIAACALIGLPVFAQEKKADITVEEAAGKSQGYYDDFEGQSLPRLSGSHFIFNWGIIYRVDRLPAYSIGAGIQFTLSRRIGIETNASLVNGKISSEEKFSGSTQVVDGSTTFATVDLTMKIFTTNIFWVGFGVVYENLLDGYYVDNVSGVDTHVNLSKEDEPNKIGGKFSFGLLSPIGRETYAMPSVNVVYNIPIKDKANKKNLYVGVDFGIALNLGESK